MFTTIIPLASASSASHSMSGLLHAPSVNGSAAAHPRSLLSVVVPEVVNGALSRRESEVLTLFSRGYPASEVGVLLGITVATVRAHAKNIYVKLDVHNRTEAVFEARVQGLLG